MNILAHPMYDGEYIIYVLDPRDRPIEANIIKNKDNISNIALKLSKKYSIDKAEYVEDFSLISKKPRWKIII
tara:strand:+ start:211 stop:426 length:216 start_codon:yes stop_codon:yes gene_type:complete